MILLWGIANDPPLRAVRTELEEGGESSLMLDQFEAGHCDISFDPADLARATLNVRGQRIRLAAISAVYHRPYETARVLHAARVVDDDARSYALRFDDALLSWIGLTPALVVNPPGAMASNNSKPLQTALIAQAGFGVPSTLLTSDPCSAREFLARHQRVIYKSTGGVRSKVALLDAAVIRRLDQAACPLQLQEYIEGIDFRVHVIGDEVFACSIRSEAVDYRYPSKPCESPVLALVSLPKDISALCVDLTRQFGLAIAGIDLRRGSDGRWICFEVNPSPGYTYYENETGAPMTSALAGLLRGAA